MRETVLAVLGALCALAAIPARADDDPMLAYNLGDLLGSEEACGLHFDQAAIERFVEEKAPADDMGFMSHMTDAAAVKRDEISGYTQSERTAYCAQARQVAKSYRFTD
jgi:hypothetical protein